MKWGNRWNPPGRFAAASAVLFVLLILMTPRANSGDFDFSEEDPTEAVVLPGTNMKGGMFRYVLDNGDWEYKAGILVNGEILYYVMDPAPGGDCNFGVYDNYFLMDCWNFGSASGHNRHMYLFRFGKDTVELLDVIGEAYVGGVPGMDFVTLHTERNKPGFQRFGYRLPLWMEIKDMDGDGDPEVKLLIYMLDTYVFDLYLEIKDDHLHVDLNPALYRPLFDAEKKKNRSKRKTDAYYVYGYLSGELGLQRIRALRPKRDDYNIITLIEKKEVWDEAFHSDEAPELKRYEIKGRRKK